MDEHARQIIKQAQKGDQDAWNKIYDALSRRALIKPDFFYEITVTEDDGAGGDYSHRYVCLTKEDALKALADEAAGNLEENGDGDYIVKDNPKETISAWLDIFDPSVTIEKLVFCHVNIPILEEDVGRPQRLTEWLNI